MSAPFTISTFSACRMRSGQAIVFLLVAFTALIFLLLLNVDLHRIIQRKDQAQNAGDAAAIAAARWQGATLNLIGELNLLHVLALAAQDPEAVSAITNMQARLCFTGPLTGLYAAQVAAKNNHIYVDEGMTAILRSHAETVDRYAQPLGDGGTYLPSPWQDAWGDYKDMLSSIAQEGIAAGPDNTQLFDDPQSDHPLFDKAFYQAVDGKSWCWFFLFQKGLLDTYSSFHDWPPLPDIDRANRYTDSEIFGLGLIPYCVRLDQFTTPEALAAQLDTAGLTARSRDELAVSNVMEAVETWYVYRDQKWGSWERIKPTGDTDFPITGEVRDAYDYAGADAVVRVTASVDRMTPGIDGNAKRDSVIWTAAAKPFGYLLDSGTAKSLPTSAANFVLPAFRDVRLIPIDASSGSDLSSSDVEWVVHIREHVRPYLDVGPQNPDCPYCRALMTWENRAFRQEGIDWLELNSHLCKIPAGGGGGRHGGGTRRGH